MGTHVRLQVDFLTECLLTVFTFVGPVTGVYLDVAVQVRYLTELPVTGVAHNITCVNLGMSIQTYNVVETLETNTTFVWRVITYMDLHVTT